MPEPLYQITPEADARTFAGGARVRIVRAGWFRPDAGGFFGVVPKPLWARFVDTDDRGRILCRLNLLLIEARGKLILVETGTGVRMTDKDRDIKGIEGGDPTEALRAVGVDPDAIDFVVVSHLHYDHAGGMVDASGRPFFPRARYVVQRDESEAAHSDELRMQGIMEVEQLDAVRAAGQLAEVNGEVELVPGVSVLPTGGHTRGSQAVLIGTATSGGRAGDPSDRAIFFGDLIPTRWQIPVRWTSAFDDYPIDAVERRNVLVRRAADEGWWCYFTHDPGALPIQIEATEKGFRARD
ncbi:MAG TPA: MBL fold metallo-hydrolase [Candidatus Limnocylindria bacterium]|nr:MBL fold metallo-hydrolase [Candidatus Limnocylindria bacterium]